MIKKILADKKLMADIILVAVILVVGLSALLIYQFTKEEVDIDDASVVIYVDGKQVASYPLNKDGTYVLNGGSNTIVIKNGVVRMLEATCPDKNSGDGCVKQGKISKRGETIVCLPNKLIVEIVGESVEESDVDI